MDTGKYLDLMPARGREAPNWADEQLTEKVYELAREVPSLPDQDGELRVPGELAFTLRRGASGAGGVVGLSRQAARLVPSCRRDARASTARRATHSGGQRRDLHRVARGSGPPGHSRGVRRGAAGVRPASRRRERSAAAVARRRGSSSQRRHDGPRCVGHRVLVERRSSRRVRMLPGASGGRVRPGACRYWSVCRSDRSIRKGSCAPFSTKRSHVPAPAVDWQSFWALTRPLHPDEAAGILGAYPERRADVRVANDVG